MRTPRYGHYYDHMARILTATEAKTKLLAVLDEVELGEEFEITRHGRTIARIAPARRSAVQWGKDVGKVWTTDPDDELYSTGDTWEAS